MTVNLYSHEVNGVTTFFIEFKEEGKLIAVSIDKIASVESIHPDATPCLWGGDVVGAIDNARLSGNCSIDLDPCLLLLLYADLRNLYQPE